MLRFRHILAAFDTVTWDLGFDLEAKVAPVVVIKDSVSASPRTRALPRVFDRSSILSRIGRLPNWERLGAFSHRNRSCPPLPV